MNELKSYTEYAVSTPTADFVIGFDFNYGEDAVNVTVDDVPATTAGYTVVYLNETTIRLSPSVPSGVVRLQRETDIDQTDHAYRAGAKFIAQTMDENFEQLRHSQQEVRDGFVKLADDTYEIIDTLEDVGQSAQDAADAAEVAAGLANNAAAQVNDKVPKSVTIPVYTTPEAGVDPVTGVADGAYFNVRSTDENAMLVEYQNIGGSAVATGKRYLSALGVEQQEKSADTIKDQNSGKFQSTINLKIKKVVSVSEYGITGDGSNEGAKLAQMFSENLELGTRFDFQGLTVGNDRIHLFDKRHKFELFNGEVISGGNTGNFTFRECRNYKLTDFVADGNRANQTPAESATKHNVKIFGGENFAFSNVNIINGLCENLYIGISPDGEIPKKGYFNGIVLDNSYRNNLGIIDGAGVFFDNYEFTNANGISPQAGIDLESNDRTGVTTISDIRFGRGKCTGNMGHQVLITQYGNPKDIDLGEMIISAPRDSLGGIFTFASLNLSKVTFKDFKGTQYTDNDRLQFCIRTGLPENFINLNQVKFIGMADGVQGVRSHSSVVGTRSLGYVMNGCEFDDVGNNFLQSNFKLNIHKNNIVRSCRGTWLLGDAVSNRYIEATDNHLFNCIGRAISSQTEGAKIENNHVYDCLHASSWMQITGARSIVNGNKFFSETPLASSVRALIVNSSVFSFQDNYADANFTSTSALYNSDAGTTRNVGIINRNNVSPSSTSDGINITRSPQTLAKFTTATRPAANAVPSGTHIYDTTLLQELVSNGTVWLLPNGAKSARGSVTWEPALLAAGETKSTTLTVTGASVGDTVVCSFSRDLLGCRMWAEITATDTAKVFLHNPTSDNVTIASGTVLVKLI